jgi:RNA polymerase sigma factor (sigma-70 family)
VVQETFIAAFRTMERFEPRPSLSAWLNTILIRAAGRAAERVEARAGSSLDAMLDDDNLLLEHVTAARLAPNDDPAAAAEAAELRATLTRAIAGLPFRYRAAVVTRFVLGMDYAEAAAALDTGLNTYKSHLLRGTRVLREALAGEREDADRVPAAVAPVPVAKPVGYERAVQERTAVERSKPSSGLSAAGVGRAPVAALRGENSATG